MSHIPQPDAGVSGPGLSESSTDSAPAPATISAIGVPGPPPQETPVHTLASNGIDPVLHQQFIYNSTFTWSTADARGKLLWYLPVDPRGYNPIVSRLCTLYNAWAGGVEIQCKIAGTGFHAGYLAFARIPPNRAPPEFIDYKWTAFEWQRWDPKAIEVFDFHIGDQRPVAYHYMFNDGTTPKSWEIGGYIACYVDLGLNTSSTGTNQIEVNVYTRLPADFQFSQLVIPSDVSDKEISFWPEAITPAFKFNETLKSLDNYRTTIIRALPNTVKEHPTPATAVQFNGKFYDDRIQYTAWVRRYGTWLSADNWLRFNSNFFAAFDYIYAKNVDLVPFAAKTGDPPSYTVWTTQIKAVRMTDDRQYLDFQTIAKPPSDWGSSTFGSVRLQYDKDVMQSPTWVETKEVNKPKTWSPPLDESIIVLSSTQTTSATGYAQTDEMRSLLCAGYLKHIPAGMAVLFAAIDTNEELPIFFVKMYPEGFMTTSPVKSAVDWQMSRIRFEYSQLIRRTDQIPSNSEMARDRLLLASVHKRELRNSSQQKE